MDRKLLRLEEISTRTGVPLATLRYYRHRGEGPPTWRLGRRVVAYEDEVDHWLDEVRRSVTTGGGAA
jgi:predicted DNA-binding transcriptional regulator AlpA